MKAIPPWGRRSTSRSVASPSRRSGITRDGGIRSVIGAVQTGSRAYLPLGGGAGQSTLDLDGPGRGAARLRRDAAVGWGAGSGGRPDRGESEPDVGQAVSGDVLGSVLGRRGRSGRRLVRRRRCGAWASATTTGRPAARRRRRRTGWCLPAIAGEPARPRIVLVEPGEHVRDGHDPCAGIGGRHADPRHHPDDRAPDRWVRSRRGSSRGCTTPRSRSARRVATSSPSPRRRRSG